jgi:hypothetical protein
MTGVYWVLDMWNKLNCLLHRRRDIQNFMGDMKAGVLMILQNMVNGRLTL